MALASIRSLNPLCPKAAWMGRPGEATVYHQGLLSAWRGDVTTFPISFTLRIHHLADRNFGMPPARRWCRLQSSITPQLVVSQETKFSREERTGCFSRFINFLMVFFDGSFLSTHDKFMIPGTRETYFASRSPFH